MSEDFVSFSLAKKLKEKGYTLDTAFHYDDNGGIVVSLVEFDERCVYPCPEIHQVLKWLREEKKIHIGIVLTPMDLYKPVISICKVFGDNIDDISPRCFYEEAAIAGIEYCLDNLI